ncbi:MAG: thiamine pyrophosphate-dependent enzyme, partial [Treponemataceae bacterium]
MSNNQTIQIAGSISRLVVTDADRRKVDAAAQRRMLLHIYLIRRFEERLLDLKDAGLIHGPVHSSIGEEAGAVGSAHALEKKDVVASTHRGHHHFLAKALHSRGGTGYDPVKSIPDTLYDVVQKTLAEIMGLESGWCRGRGGSMHLADLESGILGTNAIVGGGIALASGAVWAHTIRANGGRGISYLGDGASNQGILHESMNMAALWKVPIVYFIENNLYAVATHTRESCAIPRLAQHGLAHGLPCFVIDGLDPIAAYAVITKAAEIKGPVVVEAETYRYRHQAQGLPGSAYGYRTKAEEDEWLKRDPFTTYPADLIRLGLLSEAQRDAMLASAEAMVEKAIASVTEAGLKPGTLAIPARLFPRREELFVDIRSDGKELENLPYKEPENFSATKSRVFVEVVAEVIGRRMDTDPDALVIGEDVGHMKGGVYLATKGLFLRHRDRVIDTPISEAGFVGMSLGLALLGKKPIVELMYPDFALVAADQLFNQIGKNRYMYGGHSNIPLVLHARVGIGTGYGAQHGMDPAALFAQYPGWRIVAPSTPFDFIGLFNTAFASKDPVLVIEHQALFPEKGDVPDDLDFCIPFGKARVTRAGDAITLVAYSRMSRVALEAAEVLAGEGVSVEVLDLRSVDYASIDYEPIGASVKKTG